MKKNFRNLKPHPNVVGLIGVSPKNNFAIILEYMENGSLDKLVYDKKIKLEENLLNGIVKDISAGVIIYLNF